MCRYKSYLIASFLGLMALPSFVLAAPGIPEQFYGTVQFDSGISSSGATIAALINGNVVSTTVSQSGGSYGLSPNPFFVADTNGTLSGSIITFTVNGLPAVQTTTFTNATLTQLNLTVHDASLTVTIITNGDGTKSGTQASAVTKTTSEGSLVISMPSNLTISGPSTWNGDVTLPTATTTFVTPPTTSGFSAPSVVSAIEVGAGDTPLTLNQGVKLLFPGQAGKLVGWSQAGVFHSITSICDSLTSPTFSTGTDCKIDSGSDLIVWTKHFTTFLTYTQTAVSTPTSSGGGGGGGGGGSVAPTTTATVSTTTVATTKKKMDVNADDKVDFLDFNSLMVRWGASGTNVVGDFNNDGIVDFLDFNMLMVNWTTI